MEKPEHKYAFISVISAVLQHFFYLQDLNESLESESGGEEAKEDSDDEEEPEKGTSEMYHSRGCRNVDTSLRPPRLLGHRLLVHRRGGGCLLLMPCIPVWFSHFWYP